MANLHAIHVHHISVPPELRAPKMEILHSENANSVPKKKIKILHSKREICAQTMLILHSKTVLNTLTRILCSENANSALKLNLCALKWKFYPHKMQILHSKLQWCFKQTAQNSVLRVLKFCAQEMENPCSKNGNFLRSENGKFSQCHGKSTFSWLIPCPIRQFHGSCSQLEILC